MTSNVTYEFADAIKYWGLSCPYGGRFYICANAGKQFMGCCTSDPCAKGKGVCPDKGLRPATFNRELFAEMPAQDCESPNGTDSWYTCSFTDPPFMGCCENNACGSGCPRTKLLPMSLGKIIANRYDFLYPEGFGRGGNATTVSIPTPTLESTLESSKDQGSDQSQANHSMGAGAVAGICLAAVVAVLLLLGVFWRYRHSKGRRRTASGPRQSSQLTYAPVLGDLSVQDTEERPKNAAEVNPITEMHTEWRLLPGRLHPLGITWLLGWAWDIVLTFVPT